MNCMICGSAKDRLTSVKMKLRATNSSSPSAQLRTGAQERHCWLSGSEIGMGEQQELHSKTALRLVKTPLEIPIEPSG
jgi:hypothetical protein